MKKWVPTVQEIRQVEKISAYLNQEQIADFLGISDDTFQRRKKEMPSLDAAYKRGKARAIQRVGASLLAAATSTKKPNVTAMIFYLKSQAGWRDHDRDTDTPPDEAARRILDIIRAADKNANGG